MIKELPPDYQELRQQGLKCWENRIARLMRENKLTARGKKPFRPRTTR